MEKIIIKIPDNLTKEEEFILIGKKLGKKLLPAISEQKLIGDSYKIINKYTGIIIERVPTEKTLSFSECPVCKIQFEKLIGKPLWTNYGGQKKKRLYCSDTCRNINIFIYLNPNPTWKNYIY
ncbi:MAG: hypothetical protein V4549_06580 [Bacteroidota bacterium]